MNEYHVPLEQKHIIPHVTQQSPVLTSAPPLPSETFLLCEQLHHRELHFPVGKITPRCGQIG